MSILFGSSADSIASAALNFVAILIALSFFAVGITLLVIFIKNKKKYGEFLCLILKKHENGNITYKADKGGIFVDPATNH